MKKYLWLAGVFVVLDQIVKTGVYFFLLEKSLIINQYFAFILSFNKGIAFSLSISLIWIWPLLLLIIIGGIILAYLYLDWENKLTGLSFSLILGGALGNCLDRLIYGGQVLDYIQIGVWPIFNLADVFITCGAMLLMYLEFSSPVKK